MDITLDPPYLIVKPLVNEEDFYRDAGEDSDWEYLDGRLVMHSPASDRHEDLVSFLGTLLRVWLDRTRLGLVRGSRYPMRLDARWSPEPDLLVVRSSRRHLLTPNRLEGPADFVIEIASESDPGLDVREKLPRYREARIDETWFVTPFERHLRVERRRDHGYQSTTLAAGQLASAVLPGCWIEAAWLWENELPSRDDCLDRILGRPRHGD